mgnify:CR=1 FL=1
MAKTRVMIVDDQRLARQYFELVVSASDRYEVVHLVESATFADTYVLRDGIDLVLMDVLMADGSSSFDAAERIKGLRPQVKVIMVTSVPEASWMDEARRRGADGFWYKESEAETIVAVMDQVMAGEQVYPDLAPETKVGRASSADLTERDTLRAQASYFSDSWFRRDFYRNEPGGLCGNDDCGQMSAWYIFSALGYYPVNPVGGAFVPGEAQVRLKGGRKVLY